MTESAKVYDLENRTLAFAKKVIAFVNILEKNTGNKEVGKQLVRSAGSVGANYIEANEALSRKDFLMRAKICRKEAKETCYWLKLITCEDNLELAIFAERINRNHENIWIDRCKKPASRNKVVLFSILFILNLFTI